MRLLLNILEVKFKFFRVEFSQFERRLKELAARVSRFSMLGEETLSNIVLNSLRSEIKSRLRGVHFGTLENLENAATQVERDLTDMPPLDRNHLLQSKETPETP